MPIPDLQLVHKDARGELYAIDLPDNRELMLLFSKAGTLRGGHSHSCPEQVMVLSGRMHYHKLKVLGGITTPEATLLTAGEVSFNPAGVIHLGNFVEDTWLIELKLARKGEWTQKNYPPWRERVNASSRA